MESTTLITFMLQHPTARKVELFGSWDNFSEPYSMELDRQRGRDFWTGCHSFRNIICDGDEDGIHEKRSGGLKMGGTYWYFYRIDDDEEFHDPTQETTTSCPLMPGQEMNVLEVPLDIGRFGSHSRSSSMVSLLNIVKTLNPQDRYVNPQPVVKPQPSTSVVSAKAAPPARHLPAASGADAGRADSPRRRWSASEANPESRRHQARRCLQGFARSAPTSPVEPAFALLKNPPAVRCEEREETLARRQGDFCCSGAVRSQQLVLDTAKHLELIEDEISWFTDTTSAVAQSPFKTSPGLQWPLVDLSSSSNSLLAQKLPDRQMTADLIDSFPAVPNYGPTASYIDFSRPDRSSHSQKQQKRSTTLSSQQSTSREWKGEPSLFRNLVVSQDETWTDDGVTSSTSMSEWCTDGTSRRQQHDSSFSCCLNSAKSAQLDVLAGITMNNLVPSSVARTLASNHNSIIDGAATPSFYLLPEPQPYRSEADEMHLGLQALADQYMHDRRYSPWRSEVDIPHAESAEASQGAQSDVGSPIFSSIHGDASDTCTSHRVSELRDWPLKENGLGQFHFEFEQPQQPLDLEQSFEHLSIHTANTESTNSTALPYQLPNTNPFARSKTSLEPPTSRELTQVEQFLDEFEYLGAALL
ncbi:uncharacterized protein PV09_04073 [Verruconis gallopava]|uniref:AMP-activated protein kinase glycogen-binding domain-containing protein n=1 Tax=Verruconis gallopava TaxID=253628 RepID=A0A0D1YW37_9PEZI|nr:uncharacterized protein PV09_04073 [Verruconis gallopava]KIW04902.1 hypothetical protein PV09_04073 [Verruconis gallopava]